MSSFFRFFGGRKAFLTLTAMAMITLVTWWQEREFNAIAMKLTQDTIVESAQLAAALKAMRETLSSFWQWMAALGGIGAGSIALEDGLAKVGKKNGGK